jgi:hypothetical protein
MSPKLMFLILLLIGGLAIFGAIPTEEADKSVTSSVGNEANFDTQTKSMGEVDVKVTPAQLYPGKEIMLTVIFDTHSIDLSYDFISITELVDDKGNRYETNQWTGGSGGHHLSGTLIFEPLSPKAKSLTLTLNQIENTTEQFTWQL